MTTIKERCCLYVQNVIRYEPPSKDARATKLKKGMERRRKKKSKQGLTHCRWNASFNILRAHCGMSLAEELLLHQISHVKARYPGSDFPAIRLIRLAGIICSQQPAFMGLEHKHYAEKGSDDVPGSGFGEFDLEGRVSSNSTAAYCALESVSNGEFESCGETKTKVKVLSTASVGVTTTSAAIPMATASVVEATTTRAAAVVAAATTTTRAKSVPVTTAKQKEVEQEHEHGLLRSDGVRAAEVDKSCGTRFRAGPNLRDGYLPSDTLQGSPFLTAEKTGIFGRIIAAFDNYRYWPTDPGEDEMIFWSENHMICYLSTQYLVEQWRSQPKANRKTRKSKSRARGRILAFLQLKARHGFFEFNSTNYICFTLSALLNLLDFADDEEITSLAKDCTDRLVAGILAFALPLGDFFSVTGRGYLKHRFQGNGFDINAVIWLLTGAGSTVPMMKSTASFLATSKYTLNIPESTVRQWWLKPSPKWHIGEPLLSMVDQIRSNPHLEDELDFVPFLWSMGAYFHPETIHHTLTFIEHTSSLPGTKSLWTHHHLRALRHLRLLGTSALSFLAEKLKLLIIGSSLTNQTINVFKNRNVLLSTVQSCESGCVGYQKVRILCLVQCCAFVKPVFSAVANDRCHGSQSLAPSQFGQAVESPQVRPIITNWCLMPHSLLPYNIKTQP